MEQFKEHFCWVKVFIDGAPHQTFGAPGDQANAGQAGEPLIESHALAASNALQQETHGSVDPIHVGHGSVDPIHVTHGGVDPGHKGHGSVDPVREGHGSVDPLLEAHGGVDPVMAHGGVDPVMAHGSVDPLPPPKAGLFASPGQSLGVVFHGSVDPLHPNGVHGGGVQVGNVALATTQMAFDSMAFLKAWKLTESPAPASPASPAGPAGLAVAYRHVPGTLEEAMAWRTTPEAAQWSAGALAQGLLSFGAASNP